MISGISKVLVNVAIDVFAHHSSTSVTSKSHQHCSYTAEAQLSSDVKTQSL